MVDLVPPEERGSALGLYAVLLGICALPASILAGLLWQYGGPALPFAFGGGTAILATLLMVVLVS